MAARDSSEKPLRAEVRARFNAFFEVLIDEGGIRPERLAQWRDALEETWQVLTPDEQLLHAGLFDFFRR